MYLPLAITQACDCKLVTYWKKLIIVLVFGLLTQSIGYRAAYVDPALSERWEGQKSVIVTAVNSDVAATALEQIGSELTSELWLINAVTGKLTYSQFKQLTQQPGLVSLVENKSVETAVAPQLTNSQNDDIDDIDDEQDSQRDDWASDRRRFISSHYVGDKIEVEPLILPDGRVFVVSEHGNSQILSPEGDVLNQFVITSEHDHFKTPPVAGNNNTIYIASEDKYVYAISNNGNVLWSYKVGNKIKGGIAIDETMGHLIVIDEKGELTAISLQTGQEVWTFEYEGKKPGKAETPPLIAPDGTIYAVFEKGHIIALNPSGQLLWSYVVNKGKEFKYAPVLGSDGTLYVLNKKEDLVALNPDGSVRYYFEPDKKITAVPIISSSGLLIVSASEKVYALNPDGSILFEFESTHNGKFKTTALFSPDESQIYVALKEKWLFAIDATTGQLLWEYQTDDKIEAAPIIESNGDVHLVSKNGIYVILSPEGGLLYSRDMAGELKMSPVMGLDGQFTFIVTEEYTVETVALLEDNWSGTQFAIPTSDPTVWDFATSAALDVGADVLHDPLLQDGDSITGDGVTVAILDSGVHFNDFLQDNVSSHLNDIFIGQADFVENGNCPSYVQGSQEVGYCWTTMQNSYDPYGHGSHISGIIWNNFTDVDTGVTMGIAPDANILSVRVLGADGSGSYADIIEGIQYVINNKEALNIGVVNLSLSGLSTVPYFVDPLNRAVESAWASGLVIIAAAGNSGDGAQSITVPGNDPYIITVGAIHANRTPGFWGDDSIPFWSSSGPTHDNFIKPDVLATGTDILSFVDSENQGQNAASLALNHPEFVESSTLFRMHGTSTATAVTSGVVALMLEANPNLTPDEVKFRLMSTARTAVTPENEPVYSIFRQGIGRIWAPDAVLGSFTNQNANNSLNIQDDLNHPWQDGDSPDPAQNPDLAHHFQGPIQTMISDDETAVMYYIPESTSGKPIIFGITDLNTNSWLSPGTLDSQALTFENGNLWNQNTFWSGGTYAWGGGTYAWGGGTYAWGGGTYAWGGGTYAWGGGTYAWGGEFDWDDYIYSGLTGSKHILITDEELE